MELQQTNSLDYLSVIYELFDDLLITHTYNLIKLIPFEESNIIFSGGLLYECIRNAPLSDKLFDIDLFLFGDKNKKITTYNKLISNLSNAKIEYVLGYYRSIVYIILKDIPRIIQLIFTEFETPSKIIDSFDFVHLQSYYDGSKIYTNFRSINYISNKTTDINYRPNISRYIKYDLRGVKLDNILYQEYDFVFGKMQYCKYLKNKQQTKEKVVELYNLEDKTELFKLFGLAKLEDLSSQVNLDGKFTHYAIDESIEDNEIKINYGIGGMNIYSLENQNYMYVKAKLIKVLEPIEFTNSKYQLFFEFNNLRICNYLIGLIDEIKYHLDKLNDKKQKIRYNHPFTNSLGYSFEDKNNYIEQVGGLVVKTYTYNGQELKLNTNYNLILKLQVYHGKNMLLNGFNFRIEEAIEIN